MKEITVKGYEFSELSDRAKDKVRQWHIDGIDWEWDEYQFDNFVEKCEGLGIEIGIDRKTNNSGYASKTPQIYFSGFHSQGDGLAFNGSVDVEKYLQATKKTKKFWSLYLQLKSENIYLSVSVKHVGNYYSMVHNYDFDVNDWDKMTDDKYNSLEKMASDLAEEILDHCTDLASDLYHDLENEYESMLTDEYIAEECKINEYFFDEYGRLI